MPAVLYSSSYAYREPTSPRPTMLQSESQALAQASGFVAKEEILLFPMASVSYPVSQSPPIPLIMTYLSSTSLSQTPG